MGLNVRSIALVLNFIMAVTVSLITGTESEEDQGFAAAQTRESSQF